jgi:5-aminolevulinate synthase
MSSHPTVIKAAVQAAEKHGTGAGGTRNISGTSELTVALEREISSWHQAEDALIFNGCYPANDATLSTLLGRRFPGAQCFSDAGNHASMIQERFKIDVLLHVFIFSPLLRSLFSKIRKFIKSSEGHVTRKTRTRRSI